MSTCTVVITADGALCGAPSITEFVARSGETLRECADHAVALAPRVTLTVGDRVQVRHAGILKTGRITHLTPGWVDVAVPVHTGTRRAGIKSIHVERHAVTAL